MKTAKWELLGNGLGVLTTKEFGFTLDALLLADFSMPRKGESCADLGTGCGIIPMLWKGRGAPGPVWGVELQKDGADLAEHSAERNGFGRDVTILWGDARRARDLFSHQSLDLIACNPPYYPVHAGPSGEKESRRTARREETFTLSDLAQAARYALKWGGRLCLCLPLFRLGEAFSLFQEAGLAPKRLRLVQSRKEKPPYLFLLECRKGGRPGLEGEPTLILEEEPGKPGKELLAIYGAYREQIMEREREGR